MADSNDSRSATDYVIRRPTVDDAAEMGRLHIAVWRETYVGMMSEDALARLDPVRSAEHWVRIAEHSEGPTADGLAGPVTMIAEHRGSSSLVGFATYGPARDEDPPTPQQLYAINVAAAHQGSGVAQQLLASTVADRPGYLWVVEQNVRARAFYRRNGFVADGITVHDDDLGADEVRMVRR